MEKIFFNWIVEWGPGFGEKAGFVRFKQAEAFKSSLDPAFNARIWDNVNLRLKEI
jgi:hypothetical protein